MIYTLMNRINLLLLTTILLVWEFKVGKMETWTVDDLLKHWKDSMLVLSKVSKFIDTV